MAKMSAMLKDLKQELVSILGFAGPNGLYLAQPFVFAVVAKSNHGKYVNEITFLSLNKTLLTDTEI